MSKNENRPKQESWRTRIYDIIFGHETPSGWAFDVLLLIAILFSVIVLCIETLPQFDDQFAFLAAEIAFTLLFSFEYILRILCVHSPRKYIFSFFGIVDLVAILPSLIALGLIAFNWSQGETGVQTATSYGIIRSLRLLRVFRILKLGWLMKEANDLGNAIWKARAKVIVFVGTVVITVVIAGALMYEIENPTHDSDHMFGSIPEGIYWAIVTMSTVGYGDIAPTTALGKFITSMLILLGYSLIIVPTGFVSAEVISQRTNLINNDKRCKKCDFRGHDVDANYCKNCGEKLPGKV